jgi:hypothetical protein
MWHPASHFKEIIFKKTVKKNCGRKQKTRDSYHCLSVEEENKL